jgi:3-oxoacyl-[acyl-carrier protein] reductase
MTTNHVVSAIAGVSGDARETMTERRLEDDVTIVTGAGSGIGEATAHRFAEEGARVVVADVDAEGGRKTVGSIADDGGEATFVETDVSEESAVVEMVDATVDRYGGVDVLVNNAGGVFGADGRPHDVSEADWTRNVDVNLKGQFLCAREVLPAMVEDGGGSLVHVSSVNGLYGMWLTSYSAAKGGIVPFSRLIANQYGRYGVRSNAICPGEIRTPALEYLEWGDEVVDAVRDQFPLGRFGDPREVANVALFLASAEASYVTGTEVVVDGGMTCGPDQTLERIMSGIDERPSRSD